tara:strand:+ start:1126 stop:1905 length:780 start_codon:yes stop_codon:yes gene_type:complete
MYGRDIVANKNVPIIVSETLGMVIDDAALISAVNTVDSTLNNGINVSDSIAQGSLSNIETSLTGTLLVEDSVSQNTLSNIENSLTGTLDVTDTTAQGILSNIESNQATQATSALQTVGNSSLTNIDSSLAGTLNVSDSIAQGSLSSINTALAGTLTVTSGVSRSNGNLSVAASVTAGDVTSSVDCNSFKRIAIFGNLGASGEVIVQWSNDNSAWYDSQHQFWASASAYDFSGSAEADVRYIRIKYGVTGTVTARYSLSA